MKRLRREAGHMRAGMERARAATKTREGLNWKYIALGVVLAFAAAFALSGLVGLIIYQGWLTEAYSPLVMNVVSFLCLFVGGVYAGSRAGMRGWAHGGLAGVLYLGVVSALGLLLFDQLAPSWVLAQRLVLGLLLGAAGGTLGINIGR